MNLLHVLLTCLCFLNTHIHAAHASAQYRSSRRLAGMAAMARIPAPPRAVETSTISNSTSGLVEFATSTIIDLVTNGRPTLSPRPSTESNFNTSVNTTFSINNTPARQAQHGSTQLQSSPIVATDLVNQATETYKIFRTYTPERWREILENNTTKLHLDNPNQQDVMQREHAKFQESVITSIELLPSPGIREAIEKWPGFDRAMMVLDSEMRSDPTLKDKYAAISEAVFKQDHSLVERLTGKPFDVVHYIESKAAIARTRMYKEWIKQQSIINIKAFSSQKIPALQQECLQFNNDLVKYIQETQNQASKQEHQDLLSLVQTIQPQLPGIGRAPGAVREYMHGTTPLYRLSENRVVGFIQQIDSGTVSENHYLGNDAQITIYRFAKQVVDKAVSLKTTAIANPLNRTVAETIVEKIKSHVDIAQTETQNGNLVKAFQELRTCADLQAYAQSIADGTFNYAKHFSPEVLEKLEVNASQKFETLVRKITAERIDHVQVCTGPCAQQPLHHQDIILHRAIVRANDLNNALEHVRSGNHEIIVKDYKLSEKAHQLCTQHNIPTTAFTRCVGNHYQQVRHAHSVALLNQSVDLCGKYPSSHLVSETAHAIMELNNLSGKALSAGNIEQALTFDDVAHAIYDMTSTHVDIYARFRNDMEHQNNMARLATQGAIDTAANLPQVAYDTSYTAYDTAQALYTNSDAVIETIINVAQDAYKTLRNPGQIDVTKNIIQLSNRIEQLGANAVTQYLAMTPEERARSLGGFTVETVTLDGIFKAVGATAKLAKMGAIKAAQAAPKVSAQAAKEIHKALASAVATLEKSVANAELEILGKIYADLPFAQAAGVPYKNPLIHFSEALIGKTGTDKVAVRAAEIGAQARKASIKPVIHFPGPGVVLGNLTNEAIEKGVQLVMKDTNGLYHMFDNAKHQLDLLIKVYGSQEAVVRAVLTAARDQLPVSGVFRDFPITVGAYIVHVRGNIINGIPDLGTMFIK